MEFPFNILDPNAILDFASSQAVSYWINLGISLLLSTLISGILLVVIMGIASREAGVPVKAVNAFLVVLLINVINFFGIMGILLSFIAAVPFMGIILPVLVWIGFLKLFFGDMGWLHVIIIGIVFYAITLYLVPYITGFIASFIPL